MVVVCGDRIKGIFPSVLYLVVLSNFPFFPWVRFINGTLFFMAMNL